MPQEKPDTGFWEKAKKRAAERAKRFTKRGLYILDPMQGRYRKALGRNPETGQGIFLDDTVDVKRALKLKARK